ncbi:hypothetical protein D8B24_12850 [Verminephrobacter aporrectodeae subsp. tuberculatae]|uniref:type II toxin-antitoxin system RelE/ParE family toxin n=1 Tax=Verminephrobacter aporrectodeae TaxID=1110389 RepID=UPI002244012C|nr:type II toxin-antitoxin system RelE/ParE family toxin [Verminephrobacter aporrectodeae]MCW8207919.1 hypothetical protein [Verminephrobacter aporrectodeae subsp. tuberculatae]
MVFQGSKKDRDNIEEDELVSFRALAKAYAGLTNGQIDRLLRDKEFMEICNDNQAKIQE